MNVELIARTSTILLSASLLVAMLRRAAPATRHLVWHITVVIVVLAPLIAPLVPNIQVPGVPGVPEVPTGWVLSAVPGSNGALELGTRQNNAFGTTGSFGTIVSVGSCAVLFWFAFCWVISGVSVWRGSVAAPEVWLAEARAIAKRLGLKHPVAVRQLRRETTPHIAGLF